MEKAAKAIVGTRKVFRNPHGWDSVLAELSEKMRVLRLQIVNSQNNYTRLLLRTERNRISHQLRRRARECAASRIDKKIQEIENLKDGARMFQAVRMLRLYWYTHASWSHTSTTSTETLLVDKGL